MASAQQAASLWLACASYKKSQERPHEPREPPRPRNRDWVRRNGIAATRDPGPPPRRRSVGGLRNSAQAEHDRRRVVVHAHGTGCARQRVEEMLLARMPGLEVVRLSGGSYTLRIRGP